MPGYSPFVDGVMSNTTLLKRLRPSDLADPITTIRVRESSDSQLTDGKAISSEKLFPLVRAALLYAADAMDESYEIASRISDDTAVYWCGMNHRREGDFFNARSCFRRVGMHPVYELLQSRASAVSANVAKQWGWDPYLFVGMCEQEKFGDNKHSSELIKLQRIEFETMFDYVWRKSVAS
ncbi:MAG TPA: hypothetical protein VFO86_08015 [Terriglobia bacterium]|nr:hypothetical protein [Terriglobia bacterium]